VTSPLRGAAATLVLATVIAALWLAAQPAAACGCGIAIEATVSEESGADPEAFTSDLLVDPAELELEPAASGEAAVPASSDGDGGVSTAGVLAIIAAGLAFAAGLILIMRPRSE
jgi:hypothetical protein